MSEKDNGGPAFPALNKPQGHQEHWVYSGFPGMSLRDYFAAAALQGMLAGALHWDIPNDKYTRSGHTPAFWFSANAYAFADAMLKVRQS